MSVSKCSIVCFQILLSTTAAGYGWLCATYNKDTWKDPREQRVRIHHQLTTWAQNLIYSLFDIQ